MPARGQGAAPRRLALFDLDHTLIPFDSGMAWTRFLVGRGVLPADAEARYLAYCHQYVVGTLDIFAMHRAQLLPLVRHSRREVASWCEDFRCEMGPLIPGAMRSLVRRHQDAGDLCALVTATERFVAEPFAHLFGLDHVLATEAQTNGQGPDAPWTGEIDGDPCFREHKLSHVVRWLDGRGLALGDFESSTFYSDSASDLPLLQAVSQPVAVRPDDRLRAVAQARGWTVLEENG